MKTRKVVHAKNLAMRSPVGSALLMWLVLDKLDAAGWVWGAVGLLFLLLLIAYVIDLFNIEQTEIFK